MLNLLKLVCLDKVAPNITLGFFCYQNTVELINATVSFPRVKKCLCSLYYFVDLQCKKTRSLFPACKL